MKNYSFITGEIPQCCVEMVQWFESVITKMKNRGYKFRLREETKENKYLLEFQHHSEDSDIWWIALVIKIEERNRHRIKFPEEIFMLGLEKEQQKTLLKEWLDVLRNIDHQHIFFGVDVCISCRGDSFK